MRPLPRSFYGRDTLEVARDLLGRTLWHDSPEGFVAGRIVEVEAYCGTGDPASHAFRGPTPRSRIMFGPPGRLYVYFTYGMHHCANVVTGDEGTAGAVLLRAVQAEAGLPLIKERRPGIPERDLARGPGRLCRAFGIDLRLNGADLTAGPVGVGGPARLSGRLGTSGRIGLRTATEHAWRFFEEGPWVSRGPAALPVRRPVRRI